MLTIFLTTHDAFFLAKCSVMCQIAECHVLQHTNEQHYKEVINKSRQTKEIILTLNYF